MPLRKALDQAFDAGLDLVLIAENSIPPICKIANYNAMKMKNKRDKKERNMREKKVNKPMKEVVFKAKCGVHIHQFNLAMNWTINIFSIYLIM